MDKRREPSIMSAESAPPSYVETLDPRIQDIPLVTPTSSDSTRRRLGKNYASMTTAAGDRLFLSAFPQSITEILRVVVNTHWVGGIQAEKDHAASHEFKLKGMPWYPGAPDTNIKSRRLMCRLLQALLTTGWTVISSMDINPNPHGNTLLFKYAPPSTEPERLEIMCVRFSDGNCIRLMDTSERIDQDTVEEVVEILGDQVTTEQRDRKNHSTELKLSGLPMHACGKESIKFKETSLLILNALEMRGWTLLITLGDSLYFCQRVRI